MFSLPDPEKTKLALQALIDADPKKDTLQFGPYTLKRGMALVEGDANTELNGVHSWSLSGPYIMAQLNSRFDQIEGFTGGPYSIVDAVLSGKPIQEDDLERLTFSELIGETAQNYVDYHLAKLVEASAQTAD